MAIKVALTPGYGFMMNEAFVDRKNGWSITTAVTGTDDLSGYSDLTEVYNAVRFGRLTLIEGTMADLKAKAANLL